MREKSRIKRILRLIEKHWMLHPDLRFGQLLINLGIIKDVGSVWCIEDDIIEEYLKRFKW